MLYQRLVNIVKQKDSKKQEEIMKILYLNLKEYLILRGFLEKLLILRQQPVNWKKV